MAIRQQIDEIQGISDTKITTILKQMRTVVNDMTNRDGKKIVALNANANLGGVINKINELIGTLQGTQTSQPIAPPAATSSSLTVYTTQTTPLLSSGTLYSANHSLGFIPTEVGLEFICLTAEQNYVAGDIMQCTGAGNGSILYPFIISKNATTVSIFPVSGYTIYGTNKTTGAAFTPTAADWAYRFRLRTS